MHTPIATLERHGLKAEIYEQPLPGQFTIVYRGVNGEELESVELTGVSTYRQRETEIYGHLEEIYSGGSTAHPEQLSDSGEY